MTSTWTANRTWTDGELVNASIMNQYVRDNLDWLKGRPTIYESDFDGTFFSTTSSSYQDTGADAILTTTGGRVMIVVFGAAGTGTTGNGAILTLYEDGANKGDATLGMQRIDATNSQPAIPFCICYITPTAPTAAAHTWKVYMKNEDNTNIVTITQYQMWAIEIGA
jgi:hypothetical protein